MPYTVTVSGPLAQVSHVRDALRRAGLAPEAEGDSHGLATEPTEGWLTAEADHPDTVTAVVRDLGWRVRLHAAAGKPVVPTPNEGVEDVVRRVVREELARSR